MRALKQAHVRVYFDGANAFASTDRKVLKDIDMQMKEEDKGLMEERKANSMIMMKLSGEEQTLN
eukprot:13449663-Heterocapsa_arctica.AAC.1